MGGKKDLQYVAQADLGRVKRDAHRLGMARVTTAHLLVAWICHIAIGIAALHLGHAAHTLEYSLGAPETTASQGDALQN